MVVLGISGLKGDAAAALAVDGRIVAAASEESFVRVPGVGYAVTGGLPFRAIAACLNRAALAAGDVTNVVCANPGGVPADGTAGPPLAARDGFAFGTPTLIADRTADAVQSAAMWPSEPTIVLVLNAEGEDDGALYVCRPGALARWAGAVAGWGAIAAAASRVAKSLGLAGGFSEALGHHASLVPAEERANLAGAARWEDSAGFQVDRAALTELLAEAGFAADGRFTETDLLNVRVLDGRRALAAGLQAFVVSALVDLVRSARQREGIERVALGGSFFANSHANWAVRGALGEAVRFAPVPEPAGRALGAALYPALDGQADLGGLAFGPAFTDHDIKPVLDNCRLDYVYEPHWDKLARRVSGLLARGKVVGWYQGPMEFGPRSLGARSVLADPSDRFARENILRYLKQQDHEQSLGLSIRECDAEECLVERVPSPHMLLRAQVADGWRNRFRAALDHDQTCRLHTLQKERSPELWDLLRVHRDRWGGAGFLNTTLSGVDEPTACTPRDAIRTFYSSSIDALVVGRFLLMKDYWLLRSDAE